MLDASRSTAVLHTVTFFYPQTHSYPLFAVASATVVSNGDQTDAMQINLENGQQMLMSPSAIWEAKRKRLGPSICTFARLTAIDLDTQRCTVVQLMLSPAAAQKDLSRSHRLSTRGLAWPNAATFAKVKKIVRFP